MTEERVYYVYEHWRPDTGACFYVGKGRSRRAYNMNWRNPHHKAVQIKLSRLGMAPEVRMIHEGLTNEAACALEIERIAYWRSTGLRLTNRTTGGEGTPGVEAWNRLPVTCLSDGMIYRSCAEACARYGINSACLADALNERQRITAGGRYFRSGTHYLTEVERLEAIQELLAGRIERRHRSAVPRSVSRHVGVVAGKDSRGRSAAGPMSNSRPVVCVSDGREFPSISAASRFYRIDGTSITRLCRGTGPHRKTAGGKAFRYTEAA